MVLKRKQGSQTTEEISEDIWRMEICGDIWRYVETYGDVWRYNYGDMQLWSQQPIISDDLEQCSEHTEMFHHSYGIEIKADIQTETNPF